MDRVCQLTDDQKYYLCMEPVDMRKQFQLADFLLFSWCFQSKSVFLRQIYEQYKGDLIMMLGINAPKPLVKGKFAKAVRKAVRDSMGAKENWKEPATKGPWKVKFVVR